MNPPTERRPSRFIRGRARGGGPYRPYFYFRRNGKTVPGTTTERGHRGRAGFGGNRGFNRGGIHPQSASGILPPQAGLDCTFLRPEHYAAPEDALQVTSIALDIPVQCPGWRLYFPNDVFLENSDLNKKILGMEKHYCSFPAHYNLMNIASDGFFNVQQSVLANDENLKKIWPLLNDDLKKLPMKSLAIMGCGMYSAVSVAVIEAALSLPQCERIQYIPRIVHPKKIYVRLIDLMEIGIISNISRMDVDHMISLRGVVSAVGNVESNAAWIAYKCTRCKQEQAIKQSNFFQTRPFTCKREGCVAKKGFIECRSSQFTRIKPIQIIRLAETNIQAPFHLTSEKPDTIDVELHYDLVDKVYLGQEIIVTGILKRRSLTVEQDPQRSNTLSNNPEQIFLNAISIIDGKYQSNTFTAKDIEAITMVNGEQDSFKLLVQSIAPEVYSQEIVKAGILLSLFGGSGSQISDESEINVLLVGDPGIGKSNMVQMCAKVAEKGAVLSGKKGVFSDIHLSAHVQGRSHLIIESGAILSAQKGHCAIDDIDRLASQQETVLQILQNQTITLPFPGVFGTFSTPTSIIATANPLKGHYDQSKLLIENIRISASLLTEFQLVFVLIDRPNKDMDATLTEHVKALHAGSKKTAAIAARFAMKPKINNSMNMSEVDLAENNDDNVDEYDLSRRLHMDAVEMDQLDPLPPVLLKKFITYARQQIKPLLNEEAIDILKDFYLDLRSKKSSDKFCPINTSQLVGLIRLSQARARIDFAREVAKTHVRDVLCIVKHSMSDTSIGDFTDLNPATTAAIAGIGTIKPGASQNTLAKKFIQILQLRSNALGRKIFDFDELKDMARRAGIACGVTNLVDIANFQGYLLKKGPNMYEVMEE